MNPLESYLKECRDIRVTGSAVAETSYYPALSNLFNELGKTMKPKVRCVINIANSGAGLPDVGLFTSDQFQKSQDEIPQQDQLPARGVVEVKGPAEDVTTIAQSEQIERYSARYGLVLITNYREFLLLGRDAQGNSYPLEGFSLADSEKSFWVATSHPKKTSDELGERFCEYLRRVMLANAPLSKPQDVAWFLASYARDAKARVESHNDLSALAAVRNALEEALGMEFVGETGEQFFLSTLIQTLFYGVFSAWVLWHREHPKSTDYFDWRVAEWSLRVPFIRALYEEVATPSKLGPLGLVEILDWTSGVLNRVERTVFFERFQEAHAVQYFYEPFLKAFDPKLRKSLGVWFTPPEVIEYQVARIDTVLREELNLADGLADPNVMVLDPCCGTGGYLVEVLKKIADTLRSKCGDALLASDLKKAAMDRVFGFEILPAPFVVAHLQLGLMLHKLGAPLNVEANERVGVYLTNALTGWEAHGTTPLSWPELEQERASSGIVKREKAILVVLGNPPYNAFAGVSPVEEQGLVESYKGPFQKTVWVGKGKKRKSKEIRRYKLSDPESEGGWGIKKFNLDDLYVRFFRLAERRIAEMTGVGVVSFISNFSYLRDPSFVIMRQRFLEEFDHIWIDCMNGDSRETGKLTPEGKPDPSVFSTEYNKQGIRVGTSISMFVRQKDRKASPAVRFREFWGVTKQKDLLESLKEKDLEGTYSQVDPCEDNRYSLRPEVVSTEYRSWPKLTDLCELPPLQGMDEDRASALIETEEHILAKRMFDYLDPSLDWEVFAPSGKGLSRSSSGFAPEEVRKTAIAKGGFQEERIQRYLIRPFDTRYCYYTHVPKVWKRHRPELWAQFQHGNAFLLSRAAAVAAREGSPFLYCTTLLARDSMRGHAVAFPLRITLEEAHAPMHEAMFETPQQANLSPNARRYLKQLGINDADASIESSGLIWMHALAVGYAPLYLAEHADGVKRDWPRIPLPASYETLQASAKLGRQVAGLLDSESAVHTVTAGTIEPFLRTIATISRVDGGSLNPDADDLAVTVGWGHSTQSGSTMPGKGQVVRRPYEKAELEAISEAAAGRGMSLEQAISLLGMDTYDVYLNDKAYWKNVPRGVWGYYIGGFQVIKKWLSYREQKVLGRNMTANEAREITSTARRLAALVLLQPSLDLSYTQVRNDTYLWA